MQLQTFFARLSSVGAAWFPSSVDVAVKGVVILLLATLVCFTMRSASAAGRSLVWFLATSSLLLVPVLSTTLPGWYILPRWSSAAASVSETPASPPRLPGSVGNSELILRPTKSDTKLFPNYQTPFATSAQRWQTASGSAAPAVATTPARSPLQLNWQAWVIGIWLGGILVNLSLILFGCLSLWSLRRRCSPVTDRQWSGPLRETRTALGFTRPVELVSCGCRAMPMTWGLFKTTVLVPAGSTDWNAEQRRIVLLHELAHARRFDCLTQLIAQFACAIHWFNPLVWFAKHRMHVERERACDDLVLTTGTRASSYAEQLLSIAADWPAVRYSAAAIAMASPGTLEGRLLAILDPKQNRGRLAVRSVGGLALLACLSSMLLAAIRVDEAPATAALVAVDRWAAQLGWTARPIQTTTLESRWGGWRNLPFALSPEEQADADACIASAAKMHSTRDGKEGSADARKTLESILKKRPGYFYAEFLLASWHRDAGDVREADRLFEAAYKDAPVVIVQRFESPTGSPVPNVKIRSFALECNRVKNGSLDPSLQLEYPDQCTNADGCIYLPAYNTVFRTNNQSLPDGYKTEYPRLGWFEAPEKVGVLPVAVLTATPVATQPAGFSQLHVVDSNGKPVAGVKVLGGSPQWDERGDEMGRVNLPKLPADVGIELTVSAPGYLERRNVNIEMNTDRTVRWPAGGVLELHRPAMLEGTVLDVDGQPAAFVPLSVSWVEKIQGSTSATFNGLHGSTDEEGRFSIPGVHPGDVLLSTLKSIKGRSVATQFHVYDGQQVKNLQLDLSQSTASVTGRVVDSEHTPLANARVDLCWHTSDVTGGALMDGHTAKTDQDGNYQLENLPKGSWHVRAVAGRVTAPPVAVELSDTPTTAADLVLSVVQTASGRLRRIGAMNAEDTVFEWIDACTDGDADGARAVVELNSPFATDSERLKTLMPQIRALKTFQMSSEGSTAEVTTKVLDLGDGHRSAVRFELTGKPGHWKITEVVDEQGNRIAQDAGRTAVPSGGQDPRVASGAPAAIKTPDAKASVDAAEKHFARVDSQ